MTRLGWPLILCLATSPAICAEPVAAAFADVEIESRYWKSRQRTNHERTLPHLIRMCEAEGRVRNLQRAAGRLEGGYEGNRGHDADLFKVIEAASYSLVTHPDPKLEAELDRLIEIIAAAQRQDGYLHTRAQLSADAAARPTRLNLFAAGHLVSAGVAHFEMTGKRSLLDVAVRMAELIDAQYGADAKVDVPAHSFIESALMRLADVTGTERYRELSAFFIDQRGQSERSGRKSHGMHNVDVIPLGRLQHAEGHVIGNLFVWLGMHDVGRWRNDQQLLAAARRCFDDATSRRTYLSGAMGRQSDERFDDPFALESRTSIGEACQSAMSIRLAQRLWMETRASRYADFIERVYYNNLSANVGLDGVSFYYHNRLSARPEDATGRPYTGIVEETEKRFQPRNRLDRQPWFKVPCCPPNASAMVATAGDYVYASSAESIWINQYVANRASISCGQVIVAVQQETEYPWKGAVRIRVTPRTETWRGMIRLRIPGWTRGPELASGLYRVRNPGGWTLELNGQAVDAEVSPKGYVAMERDWIPGDTIMLDLKLPILRVESHPDIAANRGRIALQRGPLVYCIEGVDHGGSVRNFRLPADADLHTAWDPDLLGGVMKIRCSDPDLTAIPYGFWANREVGEMDVWIREETCPNVVEPPPD